MMQPEQSIQATRVAVSDIEEAPWNVNVVPADKFEQLRRDLKASGPEACDPIDTCIIDGRKYTCDGAHRLRAAKQLGWDYLYEIRHPEIADEQSARLFNFKRDYDRGDVDPIKLATSFKWFQDQGAKQEEIARRFGLDVSTVSRRISLLKLDPDVLSAAREKSLTVSHLEVLASAPHPAQKAALERFDSDRPVTVGQLEYVVRDTVEEYKEQLKLQAWLQDKRVQFRECPECGAPPAEKAKDWDIPYAARPVQMVVTCEDGDVWSLITGKLRENEPQKAGVEGPSSFPQHVKSQRPMHDYAAAARAWCELQFKRMTKIQSILFNAGDNAAMSQRAGVLSIPWSQMEDVRIEAFIGSLEVSIELNVFEPQRKGLSSPLQVKVVLSNGSSRKIDYNWKLNETDNKSFKTYVTSPMTHISGKKDLEKLERESEEFVTAHLPHGKQPEKPKKGRPKKEEANEG